MTVLKLFSFMRKFISPCGLFNTTKRWMTLSVLLSTFISLSLKLQWKFSDLWVENWQWIYQDTYNGQNGKKFANHCSNG
jgi:hypothetical protein